MDIYEDTWQVEMPTIPNFICTLSFAAGFSFTG